jgi:hypothetical protein
MTTPKPALPPEALERIFARLSDAIDRAGTPERAQLLLARLALLFAGELADETRVQALIAAAEQTPD